MSILREIIAHFATTVDDKALRGLEGQVKNLKKGLLGLGAALSAERFVAFVNETAAAADELGDTAERLDISAAALQEWGLAAQMSGSSAQEFEGSISHLVRSLSEAGEGGDAQAKTFRKLGVSIKDAQGNLRRVDDLLPEIAEGISKVENPTERAALAMQVFGRGAQPLVPLLSKGAKGVEELRAEFRALGGGFSDEALEQASDYADQLDRFEVVTRALKGKILNVLLPAFQAVMAMATRVGQSLNWLTTNTYLLESALGVAGVAAGVFAARWIAANRAVILSMIRTWGPILAKFALVSLGVLVVIAVIEDLITLFTGGKSAIGDFIDAIFGVGTAETLVLGLKQTWDDLVYSIESAIRAGKEFLGLEVGPEGKAPEDVRQDKRTAAVAAGDASGFVAERDANLSRQQALDAFKQHRKKYLQENPGAATETDKNSGLVSEPVAPLARAPSVAIGPVSVSAPRAQGRGQVTHAPVTNITVNLPPGDERAQAERLRKVVADEMDKKNRAATAALTQRAAP